MHLPKCQKIKHVRLLFLIQLFLLPFGEWFLVKFQQFMSSFTTITRGTPVVNVQLKFYILFPLLLDIISQI